MRGLTRPLCQTEQVGLLLKPSFSHIAHGKIPGRTRIRVRGLRQSPQFGSWLRDFLERKDGFTVHRVDVITSSILVYHPPETSPHTICLILDKAIHDFLLVSQLEPCSSKHSSAVLRSRGDSGKWLEKTAQETADDLSVSLQDGLTTKEVSERLERWGKNALPPPPRKSPWAMWWSQYQNLPSGLLGASAAFSLLSGARLDALLIFGVLITNGSVGYATEKRADDLIGALGAEPLSLVPTVRDGALTMVPRGALVPGDIVILEPGPIPADMRIAECDRLFVDESSLSGESTPIAKRSAPLTTSKVPLAERQNLLFTGTNIISGHGRGIVIATGRSTEIGKIQDLITELVTPPTPLQENLTKIGDLLVKASFGACAALFFIGLARGLSPLEMMKTAISLAIAAIPEGLPTVGTTTMALGITSLQKKDVFIRHLSAVENLGSVSVICFDKTGTITLNQMTVTDIVTASAHFEIEDNTLLRDGTPITWPMATKIEDVHATASHQSTDLHRIAMVSALCNDAELSGDTSSGGKHDSFAGRGSSTEMALLRLATTLGVVPSAVRRNHPRLSTRLRSESSMYMATWHPFLPTGESYVAVKGSPEEILDLCDFYLSDGDILPLTDTVRRSMIAENQRLANKALRVLALAERIEKNPETSTQTIAVDRNKNLTPKGLVWLGLVGLKDPPRAGVGPLLEAFHNAGIRTNMITGDQETTAQAIGRDLGMNGEGLPTRLPIFSRVSPADKLKIIQALQAQGAVVAMTGDGVNDSPALRAADVGIAMGQGAGAAIDAAEVVLAHGQLESLFEAVKLGRTIRANLTKAIHFLVSTNMSEILVTFIGVLFGQSHLLNPRQLLWINLLTDVFPAIGMAFEASEPTVMQHPPVGREALLFDQSEWQTMYLEAAFITMGSISSYGLGLARYKRHEEASTMAFLSLAIAQLLQAASAKDRDHTIFTSKESTYSSPNPWLEKALAWSLSAQIATIAFPTLRTVMGNTPLGLSDFFTASFCGGFPFILSQAHKTTTTEILTSQDLAIRRPSHVL
jgi:Ca2+-transporting ATPase